MGAEKTQQSDEMPTPLANGENGRDVMGRFARGNAGGPGNPYNAQVAKLRAAMMAAVSEQDITQVVAMLIQEAKKGDVAAARELLDRVFGKAAGKMDLAIETPESAERAAQVQTDLASIGQAYEQFNRDNKRR